MTGSWMPQVRNTWCTRGQHIADSLKNIICHADRTRNMPGRIMAALPRADPVSQRTEGSCLAASPVSNQTTESHLTMCLGTFCSCQTIFISKMAVGTEPQQCRSVIATTFLAALGSSKYAVRSRQPHKGFVNAWSYRLTA
eukprot:CAMPEP_0172733572 /NCGR_PEP_ID=MMETSP1074-20121228/107517_1 /TAXON_ID=2916 /ORGANISM="Ceratium fusus, Strain PA161109" /LENGTH=139 /DNA_ID=CAMNT_0013562161 /DNA_START=21 /DNA_END=440 /DNA_ORIENTATION=+